MRSFYGQRCGTAVDLGPEFPGFKHDACHLNGAYHSSSGKTGPHVSAKGWHDAGEYGDADPRDELLWAAAELWRATKHAVYERYFLAHYSEQLSAIAQRPPSWQRVGSLALWTYILDHAANKQAARAIRESSLKVADEIVARTATAGYHNSLTSKDYVWGSNGVVANYALQLMIANVMKPDARYVEAALENLHYLFGRNTFSLSWVTQLGENPFRHPHHRPSQADANSQPWPGLLSGGPNRSRHDPAMRKLPNLPPAKMYLDEWESYASNEIAINWNAPLVLVLAALLPQK
jgi:endoglucanase